MKRRKRDSPTSDELVDLVERGKGGEQEEYKRQAKKIRKAAGSVWGLEGHIRKKSASCTVSSSHEPRSATTAK